LLGAGRAFAVTLFIDSDNAMGSLSGDVDDAYAIAAVIRAGLSLAGLSSCAGNTSEELAFRNNAALAEVLGWNGPLARGGDARVSLETFEGRILALGPLTNVAQARSASEIVIVGANATSFGRWPPLWPYELNLTHDRAATLTVFHSGLPLTIVPLDVARQLWVTRQDLDAIRGPLGDYLRAHSERWFRHLHRARFTSRFPIYDLAAALYAIEDCGFTWRDTTATMNRWTAIRLGHGTRKVKVCVGLEREALWGRFVALVNG
jgi:inosine-uridine nucleoside N-ribohydrolase